MYIGLPIFVTSCSLCSFIPSITQLTQRLLSAFSFLKMQVFELLAVISTKLLLIVAAPTPGVDVERYNNTATLKERSHCYNHPAENPDCRKGCGWYSFDSHVASNALVVAPPSDPLLCELFNGPLYRISMGLSCHCDIWRYVLLLDCTRALSNNYTQPRQLPGQFGVRA
jgi:hypothetical protein